MTTSPTSTGSDMTATVSRGVRTAHLRAAQWVADLAGDFRVQVATAKAWVYGPRNIWQIAGRALRNMVLTGRVDLAAEKIADLEMCFVGAPTEPLAVLMEKKARLDAAEDVARTRYLQSKSDDTRLELEKAVRQELMGDQQLLRGLEC